MALTPEDVVNKQFQQTKFREGYDQDEVDDFLDEVVVELRRLIQENQDLKEQASKADSSSSSSSQSDSSTGFVAKQPAEAAPVATPVPAAPAAKTAESETPAQATAESTDGDSESSNSLLVLARRLHDEHVREGSEKRDQLIAEGHATAARVVAEAEAKQREELSKLETAKSGLEKKIDELRQFESEYRQNLRSYIEGHLKDLDKASPSNDSSKLSESTSH
ncbi:DivIVA domain-containing protein [Paramicrobacterium chengjingii]|uniref:Cell wall synthesis protein Wag31 n=1 Tax=Paramicrobacterium chengjingii TaxID=2769067 RepID=A0ABX6YME3_9MICO|nr:DivIVA domain-containing protein [Microbacterium chengjingii]QPZ39875.1 DivIVA domain-containing protein [Microbacterium chengjingii]